jgi:hypothetical protein
MEFFQYLICRTLAREPPTPAFTKSGPDPLGNAGVWKKRLSDVIDPTDTAIRERAVLRTSLELELINLWLLPIATMQSWQSILSSFAYIMGITYTCSLGYFYVNLRHLLEKPATTHGN